jgi:hypothetical protein
MSLVNAVGVAIPITKTPAVGKAIIKISTGVVGFFEKSATAKLSCGPDLPIADRSGMLRAVRRRARPRQRCPRAGSAVRFPGRAEAPGSVAGPADAGKDAEGCAAAGVAGCGEVGLGVAGMAVVGDQTEGGGSIAEGEVEIR